MSADEQSHRNSFMWQPTHSTSMVRTRRRQPNLTLRGLVTQDLITLISWQLRTWNNLFILCFAQPECASEAGFVLTMSNLCTKFVLLIWWGASRIPRSLPGHTALPLLILLLDLSCLSPILITLSSWNITQCPRVELNHRVWLDGSKETHMTTGSLAWPLLTRGQNSTQMVGLALGQRGT